MTGIILASVLLAAPQPEIATPTPAYYMIVFAAQRGNNRPKYAHSFATFIKQSSREQTSPIESLTISWIGTDPNWHLFQGPQPGRNLTLEATLQRCVKRQQHITMWGPFEIDEELFRRARVQKERLESGEICWQALDGVTRRSGIASNCFHAISDLRTECGLLETGFSRGEAASMKVLIHLSCFVCNKNRTHDFLCSQLGLDHYPIERRPFPNGD